MVSGLTNIKSTGPSLEETAQERVPEWQVPQNAASLASRNLGEMFLCPPEN